MKIVARSITAGLIAAIALGILAFALAPFFDAVGLYIAPSGLFAPILDRVPLALVNKLNRLMPGNGPAAGVAFIMAGVMLFWTIIFGGLYFAWATHRRKPISSNQTIT
jgi:hypothetical protein